MSDISFDEDLGGLLQEGQASVIEPQSHAEIVKEVQKAARDAQPSKAIPAEHPGSKPLPHEKRDQKFAVDGKMLSKAEYDQYCQNQDPDVYNFLLKAQKLPEIIDEAGPRAVGGDSRAPQLQELEDSVGKVCPHCQSPIEAEETSWKDVGSLIYYGKDEASGEPLIWHFGCWMTQVLLWTKGNAEKAAGKFGGTILELLVWRRESGYNWQRLGMVRGD